MFGPQPSNSTPRSKANSTMRSRSTPPCVLAFLSVTISTPIISPRPRTSPTSAQALRPVCNALHDVIADHLGVLDAFALQHIHRRQRGGDRDRVAAERRSVRARHPVHDLGLRHHDAQRHAAGNSLRAADDVRLDAGVLRSPTTCRYGPRRTALHRRPAECRDGRRCAAAPA